LHQLERINKLWAHAIVDVPYYRKLASASKLPRRFTSVSQFQSEVPVLVKSHVRARRKEFLSVMAGSGQWQLTGGSTGAPTRVFRSHDAHQEMLRTRYRFHAMWGLDIFDRWAFLWGHSASFAPGLPGRIERLRRPIEDRLRNRIRLSAYRLGSEDLRQYLEQIAAFGPAAIYAYSTAGYLLAQEAEAMNFQCPSLKLVNLTSEPAYPHIIQKVQRALGVPAIVEYGSVECGFLAGEWPDRTLRVREDNVLIETPRREDGRFDILVTVLNNPSFPLIRYAIGDVTDAPLECPEHGFAILHNIGGRDNDLVFSRSGEPLHSVWFDDIFEYHKAVRRYQVHQRAGGEIDVLFELTDPAAQLDLHGLERTLREHVGYPIKLTIADAIPKTAAGKHRWILSDLATSTAAAPRPVRAASTDHANEHELASATTEEYA
jgi:phenylacetate-CoA ligase